MADNLELWKKYFHLDPLFAKGFVRKGGFKGTDINPQWRMQCLTEMFGPAGVGWGCDIIERWREEWGGVECAYVRLCIWYMHDGAKVFTPEQIGGINKRVDEKKLTEDQGHELMQIVKARKTELQAQTTF